MNCQWQEIIQILPIWMRAYVDEQGMEELQEIRLRIYAQPQLVMKSKTLWIERTITPEDMFFCINTATKYSPWTSSSITDGYITAPGGHRIGICGECYYDGSMSKNTRNITSVCIRIARDFQGIAQPFYNRTGSVLIIGPPGSGKTTFLRDFIRGVSNSIKGSVSVLDERRELFPIVAGKFCFDTGAKTDVLIGCKKHIGIEMLLRTMGPEVIALDEITGKEDCDALINAAWCGVKLIATAHATNKTDLQSRMIYKPLLEQGIFDTIIRLNSDKSWQEEIL